MWRYRNKMTLALFESCFTHCIRFYRNQLHHFNGVRIIARRWNFTCTCRRPITGTVRLETSVNSVSSKNTINNTYLYKVGERFHSEAAILAPSRTYKYVTMYMYEGATRAARRGLARYRHYVNAKSGGHRLSCTTPRPG